MILYGKKLYEKYNQTNMFFYATIWDGIYNHKKTGAKT